MEAFQRQPARCDRCSQGLELRTASEPPRAGASELGHLADDEKAHRRGPLRAKTKPVTGGSDARNFWKGALVSGKPFHLTPDASLGLGRGECLY